MKRAILVTTGTVVGIASVLAYKPSIDALTLVPGTESLGTLAGVNSQTAEATTDAAVDNGAASASPTSQASSPGATADPSASTSASASAASGAKATASATPKATAAASSTPKATATPSATATASSSASASASATSSSASSSSGTFNVSDGSHTGSSEAVESHGHNYGTLVATVTVNNGKMTALSFTQNPSGRNEQFINAVNTYLVPEILRTQNVSVGIVTGATGTSMALINSLKTALGLA